MTTPQAWQSKMMIDMATTSYGQNLHMGEECLKGLSKATSSRDGAVRPGIE